MDITTAQFWDVPNTGGLPTFSYAELLAQLTADLPSGGSPFVGLGAHVNVDVQSIGGQSDVPLDWDTVVYDDLGFTDIGGSDPDRLVVPLTDPPIEKVIVGGSNSWSANAAGDVRAVSIRQNLSTVFNVMRVGNTVVPGLAASLVTVTNPIDVVAGDFFTVGVFQNSSPPVNINAVNNFGWIYVVR